MFHPFHLVSNSPWPLLASLNLAFLAVGLLASLAHIKGGSLLLVLGLITLAMTLTLWFRDIIREANFSYDHNSIVASGLMKGFLLFVLSEVMVFFSFFWATFYLALNPGVEIACYWPPVGVVTFNPYTLPLLNTFILLSSGCAITWAHYAILGGSRKEAALGLALTVLLGLLFSYGQYLEYSHAAFGINSAVWGSTFFMTTGLHGFHVLVGTFVLAVCLVRLMKGHFSLVSHVGLEAGILYWHFVDLVWLFVYATFYVWV